ncbi:hypothetical protein R3W88_021263 [Solanum pinnatisectum]|uniref:Clp protease proteolytic subunit n=1 Tax=Solanum pinnatisectum TaxID=50273 RepID=A0AAV9LRB8_9SOLN|nr:hypothetical protein R3W88_021263 [Solanum pinnatisectum]
MKHRETLIRVYGERTSKLLWVVHEDMERDIFMSAIEARDYGIELPLLDVIFFG